MKLEGHLKVGHEHWKKLDRSKRSSLFCYNIRDKGKQFFNIDTEGPNVI